MAAAIDEAVPPTIAEEHLPLIGAWQAIRRHIGAEALFVLMVTLSKPVNFARQPSPPEIVKGRVYLDLKSYS